MKKTIKKKTPTIAEISEMAADGKDVSEYGGLQPYLAGSGRLG